MKTVYLLSLFSSVICGCAKYFSKKYVYDADQPGILVSKIMIVTEKDNLERASAKASS